MRLAEVAVSDCLSSSCCCCYTVAAFVVWSAVSLQGCYHDDPGARDLPVEMTGFHQTMTPTACIDACRQAGYRYAGLQVTHYRTLSTCDVACSRVSTSLDLYITVGLQHKGHYAKILGGPNPSIRPLSLSSLYLGWSP